MKPSYEDLMELARIYRNQAAGAANEEIAAEMRRMADEYVRRAAALKDDRS